MESLKKINIFFILFYFVSSVYSSEKIIGKMYFNQFLGHLHKNPSRSSSSLTTIQCAYPVKIVEEKSNQIPKGWFLARVGEDKGFIQTKFLSEKRPSCFQEEFPKFYLKLNLDLTDMYYWGRLSDQYLFEESKVK